MTDEQTLKRAIAKTYEMLKWNESMDLNKYPYNEILKLFKKANSSSNSMKVRVKALVDIFEIADEYDMCDGRCRYPGKGMEIKKLTDMYL